MPRPVISFLAPTDAAPGSTRGPGADVHRARRLAPATIGVRHARRHAPETIGGHRARRLVPETIGVRRARHHGPR